jgi:hypothetical protein
MYGDIAPFFLLRSDWSPARYPARPVSRLGRCRLSSPLSPERQIARPMRVTVGGWVGQGGRQAGGGGGQSEPARVAMDQRRWTLDA